MIRNLPTQDKRVSQLIRTVFERKFQVIKSLTPYALALLASLLGSQTLFAQQPDPAPAEQAAPAAASTPAPAAPAASPTPAPVSVAAPAPAVAVVPATVVLAEGSDVPLTFDQDLSSKTAQEGDSVTCVLAEDLKVGEVVVAKAGSKAVGEVTNAKKAGMMGKAGELNIRLDYLKVGGIKIKLRGSRGKEGESGTTGVVVLTVLFGPIGLIKHGHDIEIKKGNAIKVYVADDINLAPIG